jgi:SAM-dependent methyltransferase
VSAISACRICGSPKLAKLLDLGNQALTGVFPRDPDQTLTSGVLDLLKCDAASGCGLVQAGHSYPIGEMYGDNYGYRSGLNRSMVEHLRSKSDALKKWVAPSADDLMLDIGSNDGTLLSFFDKPRRIGIDPSAEKFRKFYQAGIELVVDFFSAGAFRKLAGGKKAKLVTSIAMFYDLPDPLQFVRDIRDVLATDGIWHLEQSYLPLMIERNAYDTVCHEHLEYYALRQIKWMADRCDLRILNVAQNDVNGGSFAITIAHRDSAFKANDKAINKMLAEEAIYDTLAPYEAFRRRIDEQKQRLLDLLAKLRREGKKVFGYGASTKGNVVLQYCGITPSIIPYIAEVNPDKFGCYTPGTTIPIISEADAKAMKPDVLMVLPWHFKENFLQRESDFIRGGGKLLFPLPQVELVP